MSKISKSILGIAASLTMISGTLAPATTMAWGDSTTDGRASYTIEQINAGKLGDTITFNSISDGKIGNEKNFVGARLSGTEGVWSADSINVKDGETYTIRLYVHNNSPKGTDAVAKDVKTSFSLPTTVAKSQTIIGYIDSSNATPNRYWDEVTLKSDNSFYIEYVEGSAKFENAKLGSVKLPDEVIVSSGAKIGYEALDGNIPGCYEYDGVVTIEVTVHYSVESKLKQTVRVKGSEDKTWYDVVDAKVGQEVEYQIEYVNLSSVQVDNVMIRDVLPTNVEYVAHSTYLYNSVHQTGVNLDNETLTTTGINIGSYAPNGNAYVRFTGKVVDKTLSKCGAIDQLVNWASSTVNGEVLKDNTVVRVQAVECAPEDPKPVIPEDIKEKPEELPHTGATSIMGAALGAGAIVTALGYYIASRKKLM